ncbi:hypothetical protein QA646_29585 (plasmid) [Rhizobium sp. CB3090]|nr:hypothetical protein [Rhizobium sp. CB3090]WFU13360.1 hypothetical protein QA646_29585 [Rhizobium sp. CB3090]
MPRLISFMLTRLLIGFAMGTVVGLIIWTNGVSSVASSLVTPERYIAFGMFVYLFASTIGISYFSTALFLDDL